MVSTRDRANHFDASVRTVKELRRQLDLLLSQPDVDRKRVAVVGHDFGAMYGAILITADTRPTLYALQAFTDTMSHWYLYGPKLSDAEREAFIAKLKILDPVEHLAKASPGTVFLQFGSKDRHVPKERADRIIAATPAPKEVAWYDGGHGLTQQAVRDRSPGSRKNGSYPNSLLSIYSDRRHECHPSTRTSPHWRKRIPSFEKRSSPISTRS